MKTRNRVFRFPVSLAVLLSLLAGCGWHMRQAVDLPPDRRTVFVQGLAANNRFVGTLHEIMRQSDGQVVRDSDKAGFILNVSSENFDRREVSLSETGKANQYELTYRLFFSLQTPEGEIILPEQKLQVIRDYFNPQINVIGKSEEEWLIRKDMYEEAARALLRRAEIAFRSQQEENPDGAPGQ